MKKAARAILCAAFLVPMAPGVSKAVPRSDTQFWNEADLAVRESPAASMTFLGVMRDGSGLPNPALAGGGGTLDINDGPWTFTAGSLWVVVRSAASGHRTAVDLSLATVSYRWSFARFSLSDRNRAENLIGIAGDPWRYRNRVLIDYPVTSLGPVKMIFASDEVFYDFGVSVSRPPPCVDFVNPESDRLTLMAGIWWRKKVVIRGCVSGKHAITSSN